MPAFPRLPFSAIFLSAMVALTGCQSPSGDLSNYSTWRQTSGEIVGRPLEPLDLGRPSGPTNPPLPVEQAPQTSSLDDVEPRSTDDVSLALPLTQSEFLGGWNLSIDQERCRIFFSMTPWQGGFRANTRGCLSAQANKISAWALQQGHVQLKDDTGMLLAKLFAQQQTAIYTGRLSNGVNIAFYR